MLTSRTASPKPTSICNPCSPTSKPTNGQETARFRYPLPNSPIGNVFLRIKAKSTAVNEETYAVLNSTTLIVKKSEHADKKFTFTRIFDSETSQVDLFDQSVRQRVVDFIQGESSTIVVYGATNSGKTYTLYGTPESPGLVPRSIEFLFSAVNFTLAPWYKLNDDNQIVTLDEHERVQETQNKRSVIKPSTMSKDEYAQARISLDNACPLNPESEEREIWGGEAFFSVWLSFAQIYNDNIYDLLIANDHERCPLKMTTRKDGSTYVKGLKFVHVITDLEACQLLIFAQSRMTVTATALNVASSRSHTFAMIRLLKYQKENAINEVRASTLTFCDVASSGRFERSKEVGTSLTESRSIKNSLLVLGRCLKSVRDSYTIGDQAVGPFRESKLTRILQNALTGRESISFVVAIDIGDNFSPETFGALNISTFARRLGLGYKESRRGYVSDVTLQNPKMSFASTSGKVNLKGYESLKRQNEKLIQEVKILRTETNDLLYICKDLQDKNERLVEKVETLERDQMKHELDVRQELVTRHLYTIEELEASWKKRVQKIENEGKDSLKWSVNQVETFYKERIDNIVHNKKRRRCDSGDSADEASSIYEELETQNVLTTSKVVVLKDIVCNLRTENELLGTDKNKCSFELALIKEKLTDFHTTIQAHFPECSSIVKDDVNNFVRLIDGWKRMFDGKVKDIEMLEKDLREARDNCVRMTSTSMRMENELLETRVALEKTLTRAKDLELELSKKIDCVQSLQLQLKLLKELVNRDESESMEKETIDNSIEKSSPICSNFFCKDEIDGPITQAHVDTKLSLNDSDPGLCGCSENTETIDRSIFKSSIDDSVKEDSGIESSCRSRRSISGSDSLTIRDTKEKYTQVSFPLEDNGVAIQEAMERSKLDYASLRTLYTKEKLIVDPLGQVVTKVSVIDEREEVECSSDPMFREVDDRNPAKGNGSTTTTTETISGKFERESKMENEYLETSSNEFAFVENQLFVLREQLETSSAKCRAEHVSRIEKLEKEVLTKTLELNEIDDRMTETQRDLLRVHQLHEKVNELETLLEKCQRERDNYRERSQEHWKTQSMLETKLKRLSTEIQARDRELSSLNTEIDDMASIYAENTEKMKTIDVRIYESNQIVRDIKGELACSEEVQKHLEKSFQEEISNLQLRLNAFVVSTAFLNQICHDNEDTKKEVDKLKLKLLEKDKEISLLRKHRDTMINKYEGLMGQLRVEINKRRERSSKLEKLFLSNVSKRHLKFVGKKCGKFKGSRSSEPTKDCSSGWLSRASGKIDDKESASSIPRCSTGQHRYAWSLCSCSPDKNETFDTSSASNTEKSYSIEGSSELNQSREVRHTQSDVSDYSEVRCRCGIGFRVPRRQGRMTGWMKIRRMVVRTELSRCNEGHACIDVNDFETDVT